MRLLKNNLIKSFASTDEANIYYEVTDGVKDKPYLLFVHGMGGDLTAWDKERAYFQQGGYPTLALDLRGNGLSARSQKKEFYTLHTFALDILALIKQEDIENFIIIGHCFGGLITLILQAEYGSGAQALVLISPGYKSPPFSRIFAKLRLINLAVFLLEKLPINFGSPGHTDYDEFVGSADFDVKRLFFDVYHTTLRSYLFISRNVLSFKGEKILKKIALPTLIIEGTKDKIVPLYLAKELHEGIIGSQIEYIEGGNHIVVLNNPDELCEKINAFIVRQAVC